MKQRSLIVEEEVDAEILAADFKGILASDEGEALTGSGTRSPARF